MCDVSPERESAVFLDLEDTHRIKVGVSPVCCDASVHLGPVGNALTPRKGMGLGRYADARRLRDANVSARFRASSKVSLRLGATTRPSASTSTPLAISAGVARRKKPPRVCGLILPSPLSKLMKASKSTTSMFDLSSPVP
jgi:hypothetical protein